jgi:hypothetical protein
LISQKICNNFDGQIHLESDGCSGSTFSFYIKLSQENFIDVDDSLDKSLTVMYELNHKDLYFLWKPDEEDKNEIQAVVYQIHEEDADLIYKTQTSVDIDLDFKEKCDKAKEEDQNQAGDEDDTEKYSDLHNDDTEKEESLAP